MILRILLGIVVAGAGYLFVAKTEWFLRNFGRIAFFDKYLGTSGGSRLGYKLLGVFILFIGIMIATGSIEGFIMWVLGPLIRAGGV